MTQYDQNHSKEVWNIFKLYWIQSTSEENTEHMTGKVMWWCRSHLSRQVWGKAANPLHIFQRFQLQCFRVNSVFLLEHCVSQSPFCFLTLAFSSWGVLYRRPLGFGPIAKPIRLECVQHGQLKSLAEEGRVFRCVCFEVSINQQIQHQCAGWRLWPF